MHNSQNNNPNSNKHHLNKNYNLNRNNYTDHNSTSRRPIRDFKHRDYTPNPRLHNNNNTTNNNNNTPTYSTDNNKHKSQNNNNNNYNTRPNSLLPTPQNTTYIANTRGIKDNIKYQDCNPDSRQYNEPQINT